tara:strand:- start:16024 stop:16206 length:183 start_codon:yes stop_codon:yes gene_type:complete
MTEEEKYKVKTLQDVIDRDVQMTEELVDDYKLNWCILDAVEIIEKHGEEYFMTELRKRID